MESQTTTTTNILDYLTSNFCKFNVCSAEWFKRHRLSILVIATAILGFVLGLLLRLADPSENTIAIIGFPGKLFLRLFSMIIVPLLVSSVIMGISSIKVSDNLRLVTLTMSLFLSLCLLSALLGAAVTHLAGLGAQDKTLMRSKQQHKQERMESTTDLPEKRTTPVLLSMLDLLTNAVPDNIIEATFLQHYTDFQVVTSDTDAKVNVTKNHTAIDRQHPIKPTGKSHTSNNEKIEKVVKTKFETNYIGLLVFCVIFGVAVAILGDEVLQLKAVIEQLNAVCMKILEFLLWLLPVAIFFWMFHQGLEAHSPLTMFRQVGWLVFTAITILFFHQFVLLPGLYALIVRKNPIKFHLNLVPALMMAFGTASSAATLPVTIRCMEEGNQVHPAATRFVLPLGMVINLNGGAMYHTMCAIFVAKMEGEEVGFGKTAIICLTVMLLIVATPAIPTGGQPVVLFSTLSAIGVESSSFVALILVAEWLMDRSRTTNNVVGDCYVAAIVEKLCWDRLPPEDAFQEPRDSLIAATLKVPTDWPKERV